MQELLTISKWKEVPFQDALKKITVGKHKQVKEKDYLSSGAFPIVDQGQKKIAGFTNERDKVIFDLQPFIIFGDHTRLIKYIDFPVSLGADGTKVIKPNELFDVPFFYFYLLNLKIPSKGYSRHYSVLKEKLVPLPEMFEQKKIASVLNTVQEAIYLNDIYTQKLKDLKQATIHHLFTQGIKKERTKITEFGEVPESWACLTVAQAIEKQIIERPVDGNHGNIHPKSKDFVSNGIPFVMASDLVGNCIDTENCHFITKKQADNLQKGFSVTGDVLLSHKGTIGRTAIVGNLTTDYIMLTPQVTYYRVKNKEVLFNGFLRHYFDSNFFQRVLKQIAEDGSTRDYIGILKQHSLPLLLPSIEEQEEIVGVLNSIDLKSNLAEQKSALYKNLFTTLLHELMSGERKIN